MNKARLEQWIGALRSGTYTQAARQLRTNDNRYCCLGVLCDLYAKDTGRRWGRNRCGNYTMQAASSLPTKKVIAWLGVPSGVSTEVTIKGTTATLYHQNDIHGATFDEIADALEREYLGVAV